MKTRILPSEEWNKLIGTELEGVLDHLEPENTRVLVVEDNGHIVASWAMLHTVHAEGVWISPDYRGSFGVAKGLLRGMRDVASEWGVKAVFTASESPHVTSLIERLGGFKFPCESFVLPMEGSSAV